MFNYWTNQKFAIKIFLFFVFRTSPYLPWIYEINYSTLLTILGEIPSDFHSRFVNLVSVQINQDVDEKLFIEFLKRCKTLKTLEIKAKLGQMFYDQLNECCPLLHFLMIHDSNPFDVNFILKLKQLQRFSINFSGAKFDEIDEYFENLPIVFFSFYYDDKLVTIRNEFHSFYVKINEQEARFMNKKSMFDLLKIITESIEWSGHYEYLFKSLLS